MNLNTKLDIRDIQENENFTATILMPTKDGGGRTHPVKCFMTNDFSFSLSNDWGQILNLGNSEASHEIVNLLAAAADSGTGANFAQGTLQSLYYTAASWKGSSMPAFTIPTVFVAYDEKHNPLDSLMLLAAGALPSNTYNLKTAASGPVGAAMNALGTVAESAISFTLGAAIGPEMVLAYMAQGDDWSDAYNKSLDTFNSIAKVMVEQGGQKAPMGYGLSGVNSNGFFQPIPNTTIGLKIGNWFMANNLLLDNISGVNISKETMKYDPISRTGGFPLYVTCNVTLRPYRMITFKEFLSYFLLVTNSDSTYYTGRGEVNE